MSELINGKNLRVFLGFLTALVLIVVEIQFWTTSSKVESLTGWRDEWVNRVRELDATQTADIRYLDGAVKELKIDLKAQKAQGRVDAADFTRLLLDIRDRQMLGIKKQGD